MIYVEIADRCAEIQVYLDAGAYSLCELLDIVAEHADDGDDTTEPSISEETESDGEDNSLLGKLIHLDA